MSIQSLNAYYDKELVRLRTLLDEQSEATTFRQATTLLERARQFELECSQIRTAAVRQMRENYGWSWNDLADEFGLTRARMQQIGAL